MSRIFLSHASADNREALALKKWLAEQRPELANEIFLDIDPESGLQVGERWKGQLFESNSRCEAMICLVSADWHASHECKVEYRTAEGLGKQILVARLADTGDSDITAEWQRCDLFADGPSTEIAVDDSDPLRFNTAALDQLRKVIEGSGVSPHHFVWPPKDDHGNVLDRAPYRGWEPFDAIDAGVFFGRDAAIMGGLDELRGMRFRLLASLSKPKSIFVVLGQSGSGKSSYLRAGLIPRLQREDRRFAVLGIVRPGTDTLRGAEGFAAAIETGRRAVGLTSPPLGGIKSVLGDPERVYELLAEIRTAAARRIADAGRPDDDGAPTLVLPLDQAEELFADAGNGAEEFLSLLAGLLTKLNTVEVGLIVAVTIRTDRFELLQRHPALDGVGSVLFDDLKPMPATQFESVITGPAMRATEGGRLLKVAPHLVTELLADAAQGADALPLLALTLAQLYDDYASSGEFTRANYDAMGGMRHVVESTVNQVLGADPDQRAERLALLRKAFVPWLATINPDNDQPLRRVARYDDLPAESRPLIDALVEKRLLVRDERGGQVVIEVALESLLRQWEELAGWLRDERHHLAGADDIERNAAAWTTHDRDDAWLLAGTRLTDAETLSNTPGFSERLAGARDYLAASRDNENQRLAKEEEQREAELRHAQESQHTAERHAGAMRRRARTLLAVAMVAVVAAVAAVAGFVQSNHAKHQAEASARQAIALRLVSDAADLLSGHRAGGDVQALQELLAAHSLAGSTADAGMLDAAIERRTTSKISGAGSTVYDVAVSPDGHHIAAGTAAHTIRIYDARSDLPVGDPLIGHTEAVRSLAYSPDGHRIVSGGDDNTVRLWNADTGQPIGKPLGGQSENLYSVAFSPDGHTLASGGDTVRLWNADTGQPIGNPLTGPLASVRSVAFSPDGHTLASSGDSVQLWNVDSGQSVSAPIAADYFVERVAFSPDGHRLVGGDVVGNVRMWNADTGQPIGDLLTGHTKQVNGVAFSPDGRRIVSGSDDHTVRLWDAESGKAIGNPLNGHTDAVTNVTFAQDGRHAVSGSRDGTVRVWDVDAGAALPGPTSQVTSVAFSPAGHQLASGERDGTVRLWNTDTGQPIGDPLTGHEGAVYSLAFSADGHLLASGGQDAMVRLWNADSRLLIGNPLRGHSDTVTGVAFSPDGHRLASSSRDNTVRLWNADTGQSDGQPLTGPAYSGLTSVAFSRDGHRIASGESGNSRGLVWLWNADTRRVIGDPLKGHGAAVNSVAFSPNGRWLASASTDNTVRVWDLDSSQTVAILDHPAPVNSVAFAPDGARLATGGDPSTVRLWSWNGTTAAPFGGPINAANTEPPSDYSSVNSVAFSPDGNVVAAGGDEQNVQLWPTVAAPAVLCAKLLANMSLKQWHDWVGPDIGYPATPICPGLPVAPDDEQSAPLVGQTQLPFSGLNGPRAIAVERSGTVLVADTNNDRVVSLPAGASGATTLVPGLKAPDGLAVDTGGTVYIADSANNRIAALTPGATQPTTLLGELTRPVDVAVDSAGSVYIAEADSKRLLKLPQGSHRPADMPLDDPGAPNALAVDTKGTVYLALAEESNVTDRILAFPVAAAHGSDVPFPEVSEIGGVAVDRAGNLYVSQPNANRVLTLTAGTSAPSELPFAGLKSPGPIALDDKGNIYVVDTGNNRVLMRHL